MPSFDTVSAAQGQAVSSLSWSHTCSSGSNRGIALAAALRRAGSETVSSATYNSAEATALGSDANGLSYCAARWLVAPASGANTASIVLTGSTTGMYAMAMSFTDCEQATPANVVTANGNSGAALATVTSDTSMLIADAVARLHTGGSLTPGSGQTERLDGFDSGGWNNGGMSTEPGASPSTEMSWTFTSANWSQVAWPIKPPGGGGGGNTAGPLAGGSIIKSLVGGALVS
jgi:hypothetical protein